MNSRVEDAIKTMEFYRGVEVKVSGLSQNIRGVLVDYNEAFLTVLYKGKRISIPSLYITKIKEV